MLMASVLGSATSPGLLHKSRSDASSSRSASHQNLSTGHTAPSPLGRSLNSVRFSGDPDQQDAEEELVWYSHKVLWSRGAEVFRTYSFQHEGEDVSRAAFVWFRIAGFDGQGEQSRGKIHTSAQKASDTFGFFRSSATTQWAAPRSSSALAQTAPTLQRTLVIFLQTRAHVYYSSGEDVIVNLPFPIDEVWALPQGGAVVQRALEKREVRRLSRGKATTSSNLLRGIDQTSLSILDDFVDLDDEDTPSLPRLYTLDSPFDELKMIVEGLVEGGFQGTPARLNSVALPPSSATTILHISQDPYPFVILHDQLRAEIIVSRRNHIPSSPQPPPPTARTMRPEDIFRQPEPPPPEPSQTLPSRPTLNRNPSSFVSSKERRISGAADPLDRTQRRAPRISRGNEHKPPSTGELQAALDPPPYVGAAMSAPIQVRGRVRGLSTASAVNGEPNRRTSGASSFMRQDMIDFLGKMALHVAGERDLRETTMMMGLEREEEGARSEMVLDRIWVWKPQSSIKVFLSDNLSSSSVNLNIHVTNRANIGTLHSFQIQSHGSPPSRYSVSESYTIASTSAIPVLATRHNVLDTLVVSPEGSLEVVTSSGRTIPVGIPRKSGEGRDDVARTLASSLSMTFDEDYSMGRRLADRNIMKLSDPVGSKCTAVFEDGESMRVSTDFTIRHELSRRCFEALSYALSAAGFFNFERELQAQVNGLSGAEKANDDALWEVFLQLLLSMFGIPFPKKEHSPFETLSGEAERAEDPITRRLAKAVQDRHPLRQKAASTESGLIWAESLSAPDAASILLALHLVAQDCRLSLTRQLDLSKLAPMLMQIASRIGTADWRDYWVRLMPTAYTPSSEEGHATVACETTIIDRYETPPDILSYLSRRLVTPTRPFPSLSTPIRYNSEWGSVHPYRQTELICEIYDRLAVSPSHPSLHSRASETILCMVENGLNAEWLADLPPGVALPIHEMIRSCQTSSVPNLPPRAYEFIGRSDLSTQSRGDVTVSRDIPTAEHDAEVPPTVGDLTSVVDDGINKKKIDQPALPHVRFGSDRRIQEVERIMQTTKVRTIAVQDPKNASEQDVVQYHQNVVNTIANRTLSIPVGQGIFEYGTRTTTITDTWEIPIIELAVKIVPSNTVLQAQIVAENADWPCFHNGVAAALSISPDCRGIDSSWIVFNRPSTLNPEHGGFLLGLGLTGHLRSLMTYHAFPYLEPRHDFTSVGLLLGLACSFVGSEDLLIAKVLSLHSHALLPLGSLELNASPMIQSSALVGLGLVYVGSKNLRMAEVALSEVGRKSMVGADDFGNHQEAYSFSASMAFGLIMLGRGGQKNSEVDRRMLTQLRRCIFGDAGPFDSSRKAGSITVDPTLTSTGATLASGLMYLKTGRRDIADMLEIPQTAFALENVRPDLLLVRTFARALIMWDEINPAAGWIEDQLPPFIQSAHKGHKRTSGMELNTELAYLNIIAGACFAIGLKYAGTATELAHNNLMNFFGVLGKAAAGQSMSYEGRIRRHAARQGLNIITIALAVVMSGTGELNVLRRLRVSHGQEGAGVTYGTHMAMHMACGFLFLGRGHYTLGNSNLAIAAMSIAFFPRFLSSPGDNRAYPQAFRHLWALAVEPRCLIARDVETRETVYLPVKVKLREGDQIRQQSLISPTLIAPFESLVSIDVDSPRYWPIRYDFTNPRDRDALVRRRTIHVKRKAGFLDYNTDPKGNRSIFVRAGSMTGFDLHYDLISPAAPPTIPASEILSLISAHCFDPPLISMARHFGDDSMASTYIRTILLECVSLDKPFLIPVYLSMLLGLNARDMKRENMAQMAFLRHFYSPAIYDKHYMLGTSTGEKRFTLLRPSFIAAVHRRLGEAEVSEDVRRFYMMEGRWNQEALSLATYLAKNNVPPVQLLAALREQVRKYLASSRSAENRLEMSELRARDAATAFAQAVAASLDVANMGSRSEVGLWKAESVKEAVRWWSE